MDGHVQSLGNGSRVEIFARHRDLHVYKDVRDPYLGNSFTTKHERNNQRDNNVKLAITDGFLHGTLMNVPIT